MSHGKTAQMIAEAIKAALACPGKSVVYVCPDREVAREFIWLEFRRALTRLGVDVDADGTRRRFVFPNDSIIRLIRQDEEKHAHGLAFDKITGECFGSFWRSRLRPHAASHS